MKSSVKHEYFCFAGHAAPCKGYFSKDELPCVCGTQNNVVAALSELAPSAPVVGTPAPAELEPLAVKGARLGRIRQVDTAALLLLGQGAPPTSRQSSNGPFYGAAVLQARNANIGEAKVAHLSAGFEARRSTMTRTVDSRTAKRNCGRNPGAGWNSRGGPTYP
jgi:hypothetical protein